MPGRRGARIDGDDDRLAPEASRAAVDQRGIRDGRRVERDLVGAGTQDVAHLLDASDAASDRQRDECAPGRAFDDVEKRAAAFGRCRDVEEDKFVRALRGITLGKLGRITLVDEVDETRALDDAAVGDIKARDDAPAEHQAARTRSTKFASKRRPSRPLRSGWNWTPSSEPRAMADTNVAP